jgi:hypothetical protein
MNIEIANIRLQDLRQEAALHNALRNGQSHNVQSLLQKLRYTMSLFSKLSLKQPRHLEAMN